MKKGISLFLCGLLTASSVVAGTSVTSLAAPKIDPYSTVQAELNFGSEGVEKTPIVYNGQKITVLDSIDVGDYWYVKDVDFSDGLSKMSLTAKADTPAVIEVRKDSVDGEVLGNFKIGDTKGEYKTITSKMKNVEGKTVLYFVGAYGTAAADYWVAEAAVASEDPEPITPDPTTGPSVNPYKGVSASLNFGNEGVEYVEEDGEKVAVVEAGDYWYVKDVKFEADTAVVGLKAKADQASLIQLRKDSVDGELLGSFKINTTSEYKDYYVNVSKFGLEGKTKLYFVGTIGKATVKSWNAMLKPGKTDPVDPDPEPEPTPTTVNPYNVVEAEDATIMENLEVKTEDGRTYVDWFRPKAVYAVENVEFDGSSKIAITYNSEAAFVLEIHDGAKNGPRLAFLNIPNSDYEWKTVTLDFPDLHGVYTLYFVPKFGVIDFDSWQILKDGEQPDPVDPDPVDPDPIDPNPVDPDPIDPEPIVTQGVTTEYTVNNWGSGYQVQVKVNNNSSQRVENWTVKVNKNDVNIDSIWNVNLKEEGNYYVITPVEWNSVIEPGKSVEFGFQGAGSASEKLDLFAEGEVKEEPVNPDPVNPDPVDPDPVDPDPVNPDPVDPDEPTPIVVNEDLALEYTVSGQGSATISCKVANNGKSAVNGWTLKLKKSQFTLDNSWCVKVATEGDYYVITPESWNSVVNPGDGAYFGFQVSGMTGTTLEYTLE